MMKPVLFFLTVFQIISLLVSAQTPLPPPIKNNFNKLTSYGELSTYIQEIGKQSDLVKVEVIGHSAEGKNLYALKFSTSEFGKDPSKIKVFIFAQQHGNEQSGKEGALMLAGELLKPENRYLFEKMDLALVPQVNPDGSEMNKRRNANGVDLNRNHVILTEPETIALHQFFDKYLFEVTLDVHEYSPYSEEWEKYGYRKNFDITVGATTNINVSDSIRKLSDKDYLPFILSYLKEMDFSSFIYCPGGPPELAYIRHSTFDINDGRQSFGIQNTFSFIQEGMNGKDDSIENLQRRAEGQMTGMRGLLEYTCLNKNKIKNVVEESRKILTSPLPGQNISIQSIHVANGQSLDIPLFSYYSGKDTLVTVRDYRPVVKTLYDVPKPVGYLIPKDCTLLVEWAGRHALEQIPLKIEKGDHIGQYRISSIDSIDFEGDKIVDPDITVNELKELPAPPSEFLFIPTAQLKGNLVVLALEPKSMLGLATYKKYANFLQNGQPYPVLFVVKK